MYKLFLTAHTPRGTFSGALTQEVTKEEALKLLTDFHEGYLRINCVTLYPENANTPILISGKLLIESVLAFEVRDLFQRDYEDFDF